VSRTPSFSAVRSAVAALPLAATAVAALSWLPACASQSWSGVADRVHADGVVERFLEASEAMLGTPYGNGPLGEGEDGTIDRDPRVDFERVDCVTYLEQALAVAVTTEASGPFLANLDAVRYAGGRVDYTDRNHYMVTDWIPANDWLLEDVTARIAPGRTATVTRTIDRAAFLREHGADARPGVDDARERTLAYVPGAALSDVADAIRAGDLIFWVGKADGIFIVHTGLAARDDEGRLLFRHGSSRAGRVLDESFADYAAGATFALGFVVLRLRDDATSRLAAAREASP
jgi:D-alanyl-D-alanine carboxypeptidase/D-alanyl-D-alanine-endopeptidase (penicillin-binding protein 4)